MTLPRRSWTTGWPQSPPRALRPPESRRPTIEYRRWRPEYVIWNNAHPFWFIVDASEVGDVSAVYLTMDGNLTEPPDKIADSLGDLFAHWTQLVRSGLQYYDGHWTSADVHYPLFPADGQP